ncbi:hypothetical protein HPB50_020784 [Hyalomma asiaticum]|uniref:Uncharacterized protein n=1 Tax=Hyalomma asiaticum TaxID=266040 RepID=A0ACB7TNV6_HYAAI|nr:hypothetical protein HPB50_020784 [Hyalomma asiaticum]
MGKSAARCRFRPRQGSAAVVPRSRNRSVALRRARAEPRPARLRELCVARTVGSAYGFPDIGAELLHTIERLRVKVNTLTSSRWNLPPATLPVLYDIDTLRETILLDLGPFSAALRSREATIHPAS